MNKSESKYFNTAARMDKAFLELLGTKSFACITVKEICERAGVNRSTFYLHYETLADLLFESVGYMNRQFLDYVKPDTYDIIERLRNCPIDELYLITPKYLIPYLRYIKEHKRLFRTAVENASVLNMESIYEKMFRHVFSPILDRYKVPEQDRHYIMSFFIQGLMAIITEWLKNDCTDSVDYVIDVIRRCVRHPRDKEDI
ncbi:MAG: TetR/AcrR family transcriptional regulator [Monoglobaceae bacterium]